MQISSKNKILSYHHCSLCLAELPRDESPASYARYQTGFTKIGLQVWCNRHEVNIMHIDFEGQTHPANTSRRSLDDKFDDLEGWDDD
jgi:hypothetical protein